MNLAFAGASFLLVLYLQQVRGYNAMDAGLLLLPSTVDHPHLQLDRRLG